MKILRKNAELLQNTDFPRMLCMFAHEALQIFGSKLQDCSKIVIFPAWYACLATNPLRYSVRKCRIAPKDPLFACEGVRRRVMRRTQCENGGTQCESAATKCEKGGN